MAEVVGLAASIIGVIQLTGQLAGIGYGYIGGVKRAPKDLRDLVRELSSLIDVLTALQDYVEENPQSPALRMLGKKDGPLQGCTEELEALKSNINPKDGQKLGVRERLKWPLKDTETAQHIVRIERHKSSLSITLNTCIL